MLIKQEIEIYLAGLYGIRAPATCQWYKYMLQNLSSSIGDLDTKAVTLDHLRLWRARLFDQYDSTASIRDHIRACKTFFKFLTAEKKIRTSPATRLEMPKEPQHPRVGITDLDRDKLIAAARNSGPRDLALVLFIASTLCRRGGAAGLHWADLDIPNRRALVIEKGDRGRQVYFGETTAAALTAWRTAAPADQDSVFGLLPNSIYQIFRKLAKSAGITTDWNPHNWRHAGARGMIKNHANLAVVSQILGHRDVSTTVRYYGTLDGDELQNAHNEQSWFD